MYFTSESAAKALAGHREEVLEESFRQGGFKYLYVTRIDTLRIRETQKARDVIAKVEGV